MLIVVLIRVSLTISGVGHLFVSWHGQRLNHTELKRLSPSTYSTWDVKRHLKFNMSTPSSPFLPSPALPIAFPSRVRDTILPGPQTLLSLTSHTQSVRTSHPWALSSKYTPILPLLITTTTTILVHTNNIPCLSSG